MRNKILLGFSFVLMVFVLAGCISIPIGDSSLEISTDGIDFVPAGSEDGNENDDNGGNFDMFGNDNDNNNDMNENNDDDFNATNNDGDTNNLDTEMMGQGGPGFGTCTEDMDHSTFFKYVDYDLWIPSCAELDDKVQIKSNNVVGDFQIPGGDWEAIMDEYGEILDVNPVGDFGDKTSDTWADLPNGAELRIQIWQKEEENRTDLRLTYYFPED